MMAHLPVLPVVLPLLAAGILLLLERSGIGLQRMIGITASALLVLMALLLVVVADSGQVTVYLLGNWPAQLGISLAVDRLSAIMLISTALLGFTGLLYAASGWDRRAPHFHALFQLLLAGLNGAFLTGDLFNLFVFFEVLLIASYGLLLSGGRGVRMRAGLHYVVFNIAASTLYLFAVGLLYGLLGALNMAEMSLRIVAAPAENLALIKAAGGLLLVVFCAKAALFPLYLWLPETYARAPAPVVALFAIMTKLGVYAVLRVYTLLFGDDAGALAGFAWDWLLPAGAAGLLLASLGAIAAASLRSLTAYLVVASAATLFIAVALATPTAFGAALYYLLHSTFITAALFLIADMIRRQRKRAGDSLRKLDRIASPGLLGTLFFIAAVSLVGLPPLSGFIGKVALLSAIDDGWIWGLILVTSLLALIALAHAGSQLFWHRAQEVADAPVPAAPRRVEVAAVLLLLTLGIGISLAAQPVLRYTQAAGAQLAAPDGYRNALLQARPHVPEPSR
jgi:multicomponent K+:H+ antiporter subunit D